MQILEIYYSRSGNTEKLAEAIVSGIDRVEGVNYLLKPAAEVTNDDILNSRGIIAGSPVYYGTMAAELKAVFEKSVTIRQQMGDMVGAAFATGGGASGGKETTLISIIQAMLISGMIIVGDPLDATGHYGVACLGSPDNQAEIDAKKLGQRVAELVKKLG